MAEGKETFILKTDIIHTIKLLKDEDAGRLFKLILDYVNDLEPEPDNFLLKVAFEPIKVKLKADLKTWRAACVRNKANGNKGGRPNKPKKPTGLIGNPKNPTEPDYDYDYDYEKKNKKNIQKKSSNIPDTLSDRKEKFKNVCKEARSEKFDIELIRDFFIYWSEHGENDKKMRWEKEKTFGINSRLHTFWKFREQKTNKKDKL